MPSGGKTVPSAQALGGKDVVGEWKKAYAVWLAGAGKDYRVKKLVPKK